VTDVAVLEPRQRTLVQLVTLLRPGRDTHRGVYRSIEWGAERCGRVLAQRSYGARVLLHGSHATLAALVSVLDEASADAHVHAVDLLLNPHGTTRRLWFADGPAEADQISSMLQGALDPAQRRRLRAVFSTACFGMCHTDTWLRAGFSVAVGSRGIYADGLTSLPLLLRGWARGLTVEECVRRADSERLRRRADIVASRYYERTGRLADAEQVDSHRVVDGARTMTIGSDPTTWRPSRLPA
jgi:hypothetical protein